jgi:nicotinamidase-related amidase/RimJ/RimL family protein N-acetyltransferase
MIRLRELREKDAGEIRVWPPYPGDMAQMDYALRDEGWLEECRAKPDTVLYGADAGGELIGFTILEKTGAAEAEFRIALRADRTGQGLGGTVTLRTLQEGFMRQGFETIHLVVRKNNLRGIRLYERLGFREKGECRRTIRGESVDFFLMEIGQREFLVTQRRERETTMADGTRRALVVIDVQNDYAGGNLPIEYPPVAHSLANIGRAMDGAREAGVPVVVVRNVLPEGAPFMARGTHGWELHPVVLSRGWDHLVEKTFPSALAGTGLGEWLRTRGIDTLTLAGYMTHNCVLATALHGAHGGFRIEVLAGATGSLPYANRAGAACAEEIHRVMTVVMQSRFAAVMGTAEWVEMLETGTTPERDTIYASNRRARFA